MIPLNNTAVNMLHKYIPQLSAKKLSRFENLQSLGHQLGHEKYLPLSVRIQMPSATTTGKTAISLSPKRLIIVTPDFVKNEQQIKHIDHEKQAIISPVKKQFDRAYKLIIKRRLLGLQQGSLLQIPHTLRGLGRYVDCYLRYHFNQMWIVPYLWYKKIQFTLSKKP